MRRRLWLPIGLAPAACPGPTCTRRLDPYGIHLLACPRSGRLVARARPLERAWVQIVREAGARVQPQVRIAAINVAPVPVGDTRVIDFVAYGLPVYGGLPICGDPTLRSPLTEDGYARPGAQVSGAAPLRAGESAKRSRYPELHASERCHLLPLACSTGGRWSEDCLSFVRALVRHKTEMLPLLLRRSYAIGYQRRWWGLLSVALHESVAASLDPSDVVTEMAPPTIEPLDVWMRDEPLISTHGAH